MCRPPRPVILLQNDVAGAGAAGDVGPGVDASAAAAAAGAGAACDGVDHDDAKPLKVFDIAFNPAFPAPLSPVSNVLINSDIDLSSMP